MHKTLVHDKHTEMWTTACAYVKATWRTAGQSFPYAWES